MTTWQSGDLRANGIRIHYTRTGGDKPPVVLAHGVTDDGLCWTPVAEALAEAYDVIMVDARGHGLSEAPETGYDPATQAADLAGVIAGLGLRRPAVVGHSMGAVTALVLAGSYPALPGALVLEDPPPLWEAALAQTPGVAADAADGAAGGQTGHGGPGGAAAEHDAGVPAWFTGLVGAPRAELIAAQRAATPHWSAAELEPWADAKLRVSPHVRSVFTSTPAAVDWPRTMGRISCPVLLITADVDRGALLGQDGVAALQAWVPRLRVDHIAGAGHSVRRDQLARFLAAVQAFLRETAP